MKKLFVIVMLAIGVGTVQAQTEKGDMAAGLNLSFGVGEGLSNFGIGAKYQWNVINKLRLEPSFDYYLKKSYTSMWDLNVNVHYLFPVAEKIRIYPLAGLGVLGTKWSASWWGVSASTSSTAFAFNLGAGVEYQLTSAISLGFEFKYKLSNWNRALFTLGAAYHF